MAIAFDASAVSNQIGGAGGGTLSFNHTCTGANLQLMVGITVQGDLDYISGVTYNSVALTRIAMQRDNISSGFRTYLYALTAPATGLNSVGVSYVAGFSGAVGMTSASYTGCKQTGQPDNFTNSNPAAATTGTSSLTPTADQCWVVLAAFNNTGDSSAPTAGAGATRRGAGGTSGALFDSNAGVTGGASYSMTVNSGTGVAVTYGFVQASIAPAVSTVQGRMFLAF